MDSCNSSVSPFIANNTHWTCTNRTKFSVPVSFYPTLSRAEQNELTAIIIITAILTYVGALANALVLFATWPWSRSCAKSGLNLLIFHFAGANFFMCFVNIPVSLFMIVTAHAGYTVSADDCRYIQTFLSTGWGAINWLDMLLAANRFVALFVPHNYAQLTTPTVILSAVIFSWVVSFALTLPYSLGVGARMVLLPLGSCAAFSTGTVGHVLTTFHLYVPYVITGVAALLILIKTYCRPSHVVGNGNNRFSRTVARRIKMAKMVLLVFLWTGICILPGNVITVNFPNFFKENPVSTLWLRTCLVLQYGFTPCILLMHNTDYQRRVMRIMRRAVSPAGRADVPTISTNRNYSRDVQPTSSKLE